MPQLAVRVADVAQEFAPFGKQVEVQVVGVFVPISAREMELCLKLVAARAAAQARRGRNPARVSKRCGRAAARHLGWWPRCHEPGQPARSDTQWPTVPAAAFSTNGRLCRASKFSKCSPSTGFL